MFGDTRAREIIASCLAVALAERAARRHPADADGRWHAAGAWRRFPTLTIGRAEQNDLIVRHPVVSRLHARIDNRNGRFVLTDQSANGTFVAVDGGRTTYVHRDHYVLTGSGILGLGQGVAEARVRYEYREIEPFGTASQ